MTGAAPIHLLGFGLVSLAMVLTPGPNMIYLLSRTLCQGRRAGLVSLAGVATGFVCYMLCAALGITALLLVMPYAYDALRAAGAAYLLLLAWQAVRPGGRSPFELRALPIARGRRLYLSALLTALLNPKAAVLYLSLLPQFMTPHGDVFLQSIELGTTQILVSLTVNGLIVIAAGSVAVFLTRRPAWVLMQRWLMGVVLLGLAARLAFDRPR
ncbi:lysine transporter LysE [Acidihalobacter aeolianus]|uniref:Lysine transporter LysE n=1 Tax=Acidihalobacter aeolianus TaxID=2792603 RepID=A0A1D8K5J9_9GAMM|nr:LysE family translocator [Acidihalobacter aeolianus]AOV16233.1 lysine transporter LysE [Acidihalobacter aeolianus]